MNLSVYQSSPCAAFFYGLLLEAATSVFVKILVVLCRLKCGSPSIYLRLFKKNHSLEL